MPEVTGRDVAGAIRAAVDAVVAPVEQAPSDVSVTWSPSTGAVVVARYEQQSSPR